jgi:hypothetical protein
MNWKTFAKKPPWPTLVLFGVCLEKLRKITNMSVGIDQSQAGTKYLPNTNLRSYSHINELDQSICTAGDFSEGKTTGGEDPPSSAEIKTA